MIQAIVVLSFLLLVSISANILLYLKFKKAKKEPQDSYELREFLHDLLGGSAMLEVNRLDPTSVIMRRPT